MSAPRVGVLALQGDVVEHVHALERAGAAVDEVRTPDDLAKVDALVVPGGESTTVIRLIDRFGLTEPIKKRVRSGMPFWGTCMGMIVAAHDVAELDQPTLDLLDVTVRRNAFGRQVESAEVPLAIPALGEDPFPAVFIRAPWIERTGPHVETLAERDGHGVMVRQGNVLGTSFHPELTGDDRVHAYFLAMVDPAAATRRSRGEVNA
ncbi:MAG TPA: pyridoxal 5'-phosphate synthase glutaminase subunit PdxT [Candidatus Limnocylindrales bacterium]|nr:pyridoxal 5'-phosphate synthase glutaminase subunit PdxT [Candidatus Limnocylindrales bacterium]